MLTIALIVLRVIFASLTLLSLIALRIEITGRRTVAARNLRHVLIDRITSHRPIHSGLLHGAAVRDALNALSYASGLTKRLYATPFAAFAPRREIATRLFWADAEVLPNDEYTGTGVFGSSLPDVDFDTIAF